MKSFIEFCIIAILTLFTFACSSSEEAIREQSKGWSVQKLYFEANKSMAKQNYSRAIKVYEVLVSTYPYGVYAQQSLLDMAYAHYKNDEPELALATIDQFMTIYPTNDNMDYALYLKGFVNYSNDSGLLSRFTGQDLSERDANRLIEAYNAFNDLVNTYPNSRYAPDAKDKINRLVNAMARGDIYKARYYMSIKAYLAAIGRANEVIIKYPNTLFVEEALEIQITAYEHLGQLELASSLRKILKLNFPNSYYLNHNWVNNDIPWYAFWR